MEPSKDEFSSGSESGWTMYIGSPFHSDIYNHDDDEECIDFEERANNDDDNHDHDDGEESDDSMASDASSGPSNLQFLCVNSEGSHGHGMEHMKHAEDDDDDDKKFQIGKRAGWQARKSKYERKVEEQPQRELLLKADTAGSHV